MDYSCIVFDTAPTGHTLRLLQFPATLQKGLSKLMSLRGMLGGMLTQVTQLLGGPSGGASNQLFDKLEELQARSSLPASPLLSQQQPSDMVPSLAACQLVSAEPRYGLSCAAR